MNPIDILNQSLEPPQLDPVMLSIANMYITGQNINQIAQELEVSPDRIAAVLERQDVKDYSKNQLLSQGYMNPFKQASLINQVIDQKVEEGILSGNFSKEDLFKWMELIIKFREKIAPAPKGPSVAVQVNNYDKFMTDILK